MFLRLLTVGFVMLYAVAFGKDRVYYAKKATVTQVVDETTAMARIDLKDYKYELIYIIDVPTDGLLEGSSLPENIPNNVMLEPLGLHEYTTVLGANNRVKKFGWINPVRIKYVVENVYNNGYEQCLCNDDSPEAKKYKLKITGKACKKCGGDGWMPCYNPNKKKVKIWVDGVRVK